MTSQNHTVSTTRQLFGTDGVRGVANVHPMTTEIAMQIGRAIAFLVKDRIKGHQIVIGKDTRLSGYMIENALAAGICSMGVNVQLVGPMPTPGGDRFWLRSIIAWVSAFSASMLSTLKAK